MAKLYKSLDERILVNLLRVAGHREFVTRSRLRYSLMDITAPELDDVLKRQGVKALKTSTNGTAYSVKEAIQALRALKQKQQEDEDARKRARAGNSGS